MQIIRRLFTVFTVLLLGSCSFPTSIVEGTAIRNVTVIDAQLGIRTEQTVVFSDDRIVKVVPASQNVQATTVIDGTGKYLIPGLWDMHVHLTYDDRFTELMPETFLRYGITSVRDTGGMLDKLLPVVAKMRSGETPAPRVFFSGPLLDGQPVVYDGKDWPQLGIGNSTVETAHDNVLKLKAAGVDFIKIYEMVSPEVFAALVEVAGQYNLPIAAHVPLAMRASIAGPFVGSLEHLRNLEMDCVANAEELLAIRREKLLNEDNHTGFKLRSSIHKLQRDPAVAAWDESRCDQTIATLTQTIQVPTARLNAFLKFPPVLRDDWAAALAEMPLSVQEEWGRAPTWLKPNPADRNLTFANYTLDMIARLHQAGVPIGAGTDTPIALAIPGYSLHSELEVLAAAGLSPLEVLRTATLRPAEFLALEHEMGSIEVGKRADLVLLNQSPIDDIRNTRKINRVISRGQVVYTDK